MNKILITCAALVMILFGATGGWSQICFDFDFYCDGLELSSSGGVVSGYWRNTDCAGTDVPMTGFVRSGRGFAICDHPASPCPAGHDWAFVIDIPLDLTMDMYSNTGSGWTPWILSLGYTYYTGPCLFAPQYYNSDKEASWMLGEQNEF